MEPLGNVLRCVEGETETLNKLFSALSDPTRRQILGRLKQGEATVAEIAEPFAMTQPAISKHLKVLEAAGLIERAVDAQRRPARLRAEPMRAAKRWLEDFERFWVGSFDQLDDLLSELAREQDRTTTDLRPQTTPPGEQE